MTACNLLYYIGLIGLEENRLPGYCKQQLKKDFLYTNIASTILSSKYNNLYEFPFSHLK